MSVSVVVLFLVLFRQDGDRTDETRGSTVGAGERPEFDVYWSAGMPAFGDSAIKHANGRRQDAGFAVNQRTEGVAWVFANNVISNFEMPEFCREWRRLGRDQGNSDILKYGRLEGRSGIVVDKAGKQNTGTGNSPFREWNDDWSVVIGPSRCCLE